MKKIMICLTMIMVFCCSISFPQNAVEEGRRIFIRAVIYPTYSLSRYDYNNDINNTEIRAYVNLRLGSPHGEIISDAEVKVNRKKLDFSDDNYEKRIQIDPDTLTEKVTLDIQTPSGFIFNRTFPVPDWLVIQEPQPSIVNHNSDLTLEWSFRKFAGSVDVSVYDFKTGDDILSLENFDQYHTIIPASNLQEGQLLRILVICSWIFKEYIRGDEIARGSEINMVPWSQVFIRTKQIE